LNLFEIRLLWFERKHAGNVFKEAGTWCCAGTSHV
jgi:hypothetical protein